MPDNTSPFGPSLGLDERAQLLDEIALEFDLCINVQDVASGTFTYVSAAWEDLTGLPVDRWLDDPAAWLEMIHPDDRNYTIELAEDGHKRRRTAHDVRILHRDGTVHWILGWTVPIMDATGKLTRIIGICHDITARKAAEAALRKELLASEQGARAHQIALHRVEAQLQRALAELGRKDADVTVGSAAYESLTPRESDVFHTVVRGLPNKAIAAELGIVVSTVKVHRARVFAKFGVDNVAQLVTRAVRAGLFDREPEG
ncbi:MAG: PAS domain S-box-containing protein [Myxococcota bacterium]|jgi:PAS domain S-box-containing protein